MLHFTDHFLPDPIFTFLNGRQMTREGILGRFKHEIHAVRYPSRGWRETLVWEATAAGKQSEAYQAMKRTMGDDWVSDLTESEAVVDCAMALGYRGE